MVAVGRPGRPTSGATTWATGTLGPGEHRTVRIPVTFEGPVWGHYTVRVDVRGADRPVVAFAHSHTYPWLWILPLILILGWHLQRSAGKSDRSS
ncbi:hypothetical protein [Actinoplanes couchii]|uniref:Uncharacterized protein n=1 Tax=Actinoplanes couchii TaxID=403638 RepID=A0ABQ3X899_9ACTN|nr:hypothetical protein [Actinoplanes couchii]MDR6320268.1 hypothetical protein [Actinoplanes couchii]GID54717.1 hypothetical protein Aco03nite_031210 [Actinoplanes couchii]